MSTSDFELATPPTVPRHRELWLQHAAGFILFEDARRYALARLDPGLDDAARTVAERAIDDALYGVMMVIDGVTGGLRREELCVQLQVKAQLVRRAADGDEVLAELDLRNEGDGMCMGFHGWREGDFGADPVVRVRTRSFITCEERVHHT